MDEQSRPRKKEGPVARGGKTRGGGKQKKNKVVVNTVRCRTVPAARVRCNVGPAGQSRELVVPWSLVREAALYARCQWQHLIVAGIFVSS